MRLKRPLLLLLLLLLLGAAHFYYWYWPRERAVPPPPPAANGTPFAGLAAGAYDVCLWIPYPHQNLGVLASSVADLPEVIAAATRLNRGESATSPRDPASGGARSPQEVPAFGPFEVPPADEMLACADLAGGRLRIVARIYPVLSLVAKAAGHLAGNPWLAGGEAGRTRIRWQGRLWTVTAGAEQPPSAPPAVAAASRDLTQPPALPPSLAVVRWAGARAEIPPGWYALTREGSNLVLALVHGEPTSPSGAPLPAPVTGAALVAAVGPDWQGALPFGRSASGGGVLAAGRDAGATFDPTRPMWRGYPRPAAEAPASPAGVTGADRAGRDLPVGAAPAQQAAAVDPTRPMWTDPSAPAIAPPPPPSGPRPPAALALFESGSSRLSSLGDLPGLAVFNVATAGRERWGLPAAGIFRLAAGRLPAADQAGWHILALDPGSLRQAEALAPQLAALVPPQAPGDPPAGPATPLSLGIWLDPRATLRIVTRIRKFVDDFPLASRPEVQLWRDWETLLDPLGRCDHAVLTATSTPPSLRLLLQGCTTVIPHPAKDDG